MSLRALAGGGDPMSEVFSFGSYYPGREPAAPARSAHQAAGGRRVPHHLTACAISWRSPPSGRSWSRSTPSQAFPPGRAARSLAPLLAIVVVVSVLRLFTDHSGPMLFQLGIFSVSEGSLYSCAFTAVRMLFMMCGMSLVTMTTMTLDLTQAVERLLAPFARVGLPAHELGMMLGIALRFMPQFATELQTTYRAAGEPRRARGVRPLGQRAHALERVHSACSRASSAMPRRYLPHGCALLPRRGGPHAHASAALCPSRCRCRCGAGGARPVRRPRISRAARHGFPHT